MRIVMDLQACQSESRFRGIGRYSMNLAQAMIRNGKEHDIFIMLNSQYPDSIHDIRQALHGLLPKDHIVVFHTPQPVCEKNPANVWRTRAAELVRLSFLESLHPDAIYIHSLFEGYIDHIVTSIGELNGKYITAVTLYDLIPLVHQDTYLSDSTMSQWYLGKIESLKRADLICAISDYSHFEAISMLGLHDENVVAISSAIDDSFERRTYPKADQQMIKDQYGIFRPFVMYTGGGDYRKNIEGLIQAYARLPEIVRNHHQLAVVCSLSDAERLRLRDLVRGSGLHDYDVVFTGYVPDQHLIALYNLCKLFVFPSFHEGFGLPILEAMACGAPVIGSNKTSIPEVIGREDALFDPGNINSIMEKLNFALTDIEFLDSLQNHSIRQVKRFSWDHTAQCAIRALESKHQIQVSQRRLVVSDRVARPSMAFISPMPPEQSGISTYSVELLPELSHFYDITVIVDQPTVDSSCVPQNIPIRNVAWFIAHARQFDRVLYQFGNSAFHKHMFDLLEHFPGVVVLHDFYLSGVIRWMEITGYMPRFFQKSLYESHGYEPFIAFDSDDPDATLYKYPCNKAVLDQAAGLVTHSQFAFEAARLWYGPEAAGEFARIPHLRALPDTPSRTESRVQLGFSENDFIICSFGMLGPTKLNHRLLEAWLASPLVKDLHSHLVFVGENQEGEYGHLLNRMIAKSSAKDRIRITGYASPEVYQNYLAAADLAVQLRVLSRGETSGAALDALAFGLPLIVNSHGTMAEYPAHIVVKIPDQFTTEELTAALIHLRENSQARCDLSAAGRQYISQCHDPCKVAEHYRETIERFQNSSIRSDYRQLLNALADVCIAGKPGDMDIMQLARSITANLSHPRLPRLFIDITEFISTGDNHAKNKISRTWLDYLKHAPKGFRVEPVYSDTENYRYARSFIFHMLTIDDPIIEDDIIDVTSNDILLLAELTQKSDRVRQRLDHYSNLGLNILPIGSSISFDDNIEWLSMENQAELLKWVNQYQTFFLPSKAN